MSLPMLANTLSHNVALWVALTPDDIVQCEESARSIKECMPGICTVVGTPLDETEDIDSVDMLYILEPRRVGFAILRIAFIKSLMWDYAKFGHNFMLAQPSFRMSEPLMDEILMLNRFSMIFFTPRPEEYMWNVNKQPVDFDIIPKKFPTLDPSLILIEKNAETPMFLHLWELTQDDYIKNNLDKSIAMSLRSTLWYSRLAWLDSLILHRETT